MKLQLLTQNSKIKMSGNTDIIIFNFGIPAFRSASGEMTCTMAGACASGCYAKSGAYLFSNVAAKFEQRFEATKAADFTLQIQDDLNRIKRRYLGVKKIMVRIHDSGDFYSEDYLLAWFDIMQTNPELEFYAYTKQVEMLKRASKYMPGNFKVIFSFGGKQDALIDISKDRHSLVFETVEQLEAAGYINASELDLYALTNNPKVGLVFHHAKKFSNTLWSKVQNDVQNAK